MYIFKISLVINENVRLAFFYVLSRDEFGYYYNDTYGTRGFYSMANIRTQSKSNKEGNQENATFIDYMLLVVLF